MPHATRNVKHSALLPDRLKSHIPPVLTTTAGAVINTRLVLPPPLPLSWAAERWLKEQGIDLSRDLGPQEVAMEGLSEEDACGDQGQEGDVEMDEVSGGEGAAAGEEGATHHQVKCIKVRTSVCVFLSRGVN